MSKFRNKIKTIYSFDDAKLTHTHFSLDIHHMYNKELYCCFLLRNIYVFYLFFHKHKRVILRLQKCIYTVLINIQIFELLHYSFKVLINFHFVYNYMHGA